MIWHREIDFVESCVRNGDPIREAHVYTSLYYIYYYIKNDGSYCYNEIVSNASEPTSRNQNIYIEGTDAQTIGYKHIFYQPIDKRAILSKDPAIAMRFPAKNSLVATQDLFEKQLLIEEGRGQSKISVKEQAV